MFEQLIEHDVRRISAHLRLKNETVATAESCTAGLVAYGLTSIAGSSDYLKQGWVVYQTVSKQREFMLPYEIDIYSNGCASHLARASQLKADANFGIGVTGKADENKGIVWYAFAFEHLGRPVGLEFSSCEFTGTRNEIRQAAAAHIIKAFADQLERL